MTYKPQHGKLQGITNDPKEIGEFAVGLMVFAVVYWSVVFLILWGLTTLLKTL